MLKALRAWWHRTETPIPDDAVCVHCQKTHAEHIVMPGPLGVPCYLCADEWTDFRWAYPSRGHGVHPAVTSGCG